MPPSLSVSVGVPPATVTASLRFTVSVTTLPASRSPAPAVMPVPDATTEATVGAVVSICSVPAGLVTAPERLAALPAPSLMVAAVEIDRRHRQVGGVLAGPHRVAEGQRIGAGAAGVGRGAAVVERQRRGAARHRHRLAQVDRQRHHAAGREVAGTRRDAGAGRHHRRHRRRRGVDLQRAGRVGHRARKVGRVAGAVLDGRRRSRLTAVTARSAVFWPAPTV